jgi:hypothetical protein
MMRVSSSRGAWAIACGFGLLEAIYDKVLIFRPQPGLLCFSLEGRVFLGHSESPDGLNSRSANACIPADQRKLQSQRRGGNDPVRHVRNVVPADNFNSINDRSIHWHKPGRFIWVIKSLQQTLPGDHRQSFLFDQVHKFDEADGGNVNRMSAFGRGVQGLNGAF